VRRDGGAPVSASAARLVASTPFIIAGVCSRFLSGIQLLLMSGAEDACLSLVFYLFSRARDGDCQDSGLHIRSSCTPQSTTDAPVVRDRLVWHVKGSLPSRGTMPVRRAVCCRRSASPAFHEAQTNAYPEPFLSCTHLLL